MNDMLPVPPSAHRRNAFRLGDVISGEPQLYCDYTPPRWTPRAYLLLVALWRGLIAIRRRLRRTAAQPEADTASALPAAATKPQRAEPIRRAA